MKIPNLFFIPALFLLCQACDTQRGNADMQGHLMYACGSDAPMGNVKVAFTAFGAELLSTRTDAFGYFHLQGEYKIKGRPTKVAKPRLEIIFDGKNGGGFGSVDLMSDPPDVFNDTIYRYNSTLSVLRVDLDTSIFGDATDTLMVEYRFDASVNELDQRFFSGPFTNGQILDTIQTATNSHVGYERGLGLYHTCCGLYWIKQQGQEWEYINRVDYPWVEGMPNKACGRYTLVDLKLENSVR